MAAFFLAAFFHHLLVDIYSEFSTVKQVHDYFYDDQSDQTRKAFFSKVCELAQETMKQKDGELKELRLKEPAAWYQGLYTNYCQEAQDNLSAKLVELRHKRMLIAVDECSFLDQSRAQTRGMTLIAFLRILHAQSTHTSKVLYWYPILDTNTSVGTFYPTKENAASNRQGDSMPLLPPYVHLPFDVFVPGEPSTPIDALHITHLVKFGRAVSGQSALVVGMSLMAA